MKKRFLSLFFAFFLTPPVSFAATEVTLDPLGQPMPAVSVAEAPASVEPAPAGTPAGNSDVSDFLMDNGGLEIVRGSAEDAEVSLAALSYNDALYSSPNNYWFEQADAKLAQDVSAGAGVLVAEIDTGISAHEDGALLWSNPGEILDGIDNDGNGYIDDTNGWDFFNGDRDPSDDNGHGTFVSGIIGAAANNLLGIVGIAPKSQIVPIKVLNSQGSGYVTDVIKGIRYAADLGAKVINMSLGVFKNYLSQSLQQSFIDAMNYAKSKGAVTVAAAGNDNMDLSKFYPAAIATLAAGAVDSALKRASWSNYGTGLDLVAAGVNVLSLRAAGTNFGSSCVSNPKYACASGTSFSSPIVAAVVALLRASEPLLTVDQIYKRLTSTARDLGTKGFDKYYGYGLVDAYKALTTVTGASSNALSPSETGSGSGKIPEAKQNAFFPDFPELGRLPGVSPRLLTHYQWDPTRNHLPKSKRRNPKD